MFLHVSVCPQGGGACSGGSAPGGVSAGGRCLLWGGLLPGDVETPVTATAAGGTRPTGMHSCLFVSFKNYRMS